MVAWLPFCAIRFSAWTTIRQWGFCATADTHYAPRWELAAPVGAQGAKACKTLCAGEPNCDAYAAKWSPNNQDNSHCYLYGLDIAKAFGGNAPGPAVTVAYLKKVSWKLVAAKASLVSNARLCVPARAHALVRGESERRLEDTLGRRCSPPPLSLSPSVHVCLCVGVSLSPCPCLCLSPSVSVLGPLCVVLALCRSHPHTLLPCALISPRTFPSLYVQTPPVGLPTAGVGSESYQCYVKTPSTPATTTTTKTTMKATMLVTLGQGVCQTADGSTQPHFYKSQVSRAQCQDRCNKAPLCEGIFWCV